MRVVNNAKMQLSEKRIKEYQKIHEKEYGEKLSWEKASEAAHNLLNFVDLIYQIHRKDCLRQSKLRKSPKGFHLTDGSYTCCLCHGSTTSDNSWYDKNGIKYMDCQRAVDKKKIPISACKNDDSWYAVWEFDHYFNIKSPTVRKFVRQGKLKSRIVPGINGGIHFEIFMIKDNQGVLPEKPESRLVKDKDGMTHVEYDVVTLKTGLR